MTDGGFERHLRRITRTNLLRRDHAVNLLQKLDYFEFEIPDGGMSLWVKINHPIVKASELVKQARTKGIYMQHGAEYQLTPTDNQDNYLRIGYAGMNEDRFSKGIALLTSLIKIINPN